MRDERRAHRLESGQQQSDQEEHMSGCKHEFTKARQSLHWTFGIQKSSTENFNLKTENDGDCSEGPVSLAGDVNLCQRR